jgi:hypothetical protein
MELNLDMLLDLLWVASGQILHKVIEQIFNYELFCIYAISALLIFEARYKLIFVPNL